MEETRAALSDKLETLEQRVVDTVSGTTAAVSETVENVKEAVQDTVGTVKETFHETVGTVKETFQEGVASVRNAFDLSRQMESHPWLFLAGSVAVGYCAGCLLEESLESAASNGLIGSHSTGRAEAFSTGTSWEEERLGEDARERPRTAHRQDKSGFVDTLASQFAPEISKVKSLAIGAGLGLVRDLLTQSEVVPGSLRPRIRELIDSATTKLGGETVQGPLWQGSCPRSA